MSDTVTLGEIRRLSQRGYARHVRGLVNAERVLLRMYNAAARAIAALAATADSPEVVATLGPQIESRLRELTDRVAGRIEAHTTVESARGISEASASIRLSGRARPGWEVTIPRDSIAFRTIHDRAVRLLATGPDGIALSPRVWNVHQVTLQDMTRWLAQATIEGRPRHLVLREMRAFLVRPDVDLRTRAWREFFRRNPPGRGVYRSARKNALRVLRTESNRAFRAGVAEYAKSRDWVRGIRWVLAPGHPEPDICDGLAAQDAHGLGPGVYPPGSLPDTPHPH